MIRFDDLNVNPENVAMFYEDQIRKTAIDDSINGRKISPHLVSATRFVMWNGEYVSVPYTTDVVLAMINLPYSFINIGGRYLNPKWVTHVRDSIVKRTVADNEEIKQDEPIVISSTTTINVVEVHCVEIVVVEGTSADQVCQAIAAALNPPQQK
jgi:hypothetical protein